MEPRWSTQLPVQKFRNSPSSVAVHLEQGITGCVDALIARASYGHGQMVFDFDKLELV